MNKCNCPKKGICQRCLKSFKEHYQESSPHWGLNTCCINWLPEGYKEYLKETINVIKFKLIKE